MVEQHHDPDECNEAGEGDAPDPQLGYRKEERGKELQYAHHPIKLARMLPLTKPRANISISPVLWRKRRRMPDRPPHIPKVALLGALREGVGCCCDINWLEHQLGSL